MSLSEISRLYMKLNAKHYQENSSVQKNFAHSLLAQHHIQSNECILDIGCGDGALTAAMASIALEGHVLGVDPSEEMVKLAREHYSTQLNNLEFRRGKAEDVDGEDCYTLVTAFSCLHWVSDLKCVLQHCYQALRPGGHMLGVTYPAESAYWFPFLEVLKQPKWQAYYQKSTLPRWMLSKDIKALASQVGFNLSRWETIDAVIDYPTAQAFKDYVTGWLPCLLPADHSTQMAFLEEVVTQVHSRYADGNGFNIPYTKLEMVLEKPLAV